MADATEQAAGSRQQAAGSPRPASLITQHSLLITRHSALVLCGAALGVYLFVVPIGIVLLGLGWLPPEAGWVGGVLLGAQAVALTAWGALNWGWRRGLGAAVGIAGAAWLLEAVGVTTGVPFGAYHYSGVLGALLGPVPAAIPCAWVASIGAAYWTARRILPARGAGGAAVLALTAALATLQDAVLEPVATRVQGYWTWDMGQTSGLDYAAVQTGGLSYGDVPWSNYAAWFGAALVLAWGLSRLWPEAEPGRAALRYGWLPLLLYVMNAGMFGLLDGSRGLLLPAALAGLLLLILCWRLR